MQGLELMVSSLRFCGARFKRYGLEFAVRCAGFRVYVLEFKGCGAGLRVCGLDFKVCGARFRVEGLEFKVCGAGRRVEGLGLKASFLSCALLHRWNEVRKRHRRNPPPKVAQHRSF